MSVVIFCFNSGSFIFSCPLFNNVFFYFHALSHSVTPLHHNGFIALLEIKLAKMADHPCVIIFENFNHHLYLWPSALTYKYIFIKLLWVPLLGEKSYTLLLLFRKFACILSSNMSGITIHTLSNDVQIIN